MASLSVLGISRTLREERITFLTKSDLRRRFGVKSDNTAYKILQRMTQKGLLTRLQAGHYQIAETPVHDFTVANTIVPPSYISLESALARYGILQQVPFVVTSVTPKKGRTVEIHTKTFEYTHIAPHLFMGFVKEGDYLIATPEKALFDAVYMTAKGLRSLSVDELELSHLNKKLFGSYCQKARLPQLDEYLKTHTIL